MAIDQVLFSLSFSVTFEAMNSLNNIRTTATTNPRDISTLGFLWMNEDGLGFNPTIVISGVFLEDFLKVFPEVLCRYRTRQPERVSHHCQGHETCTFVAGRATTCWMAHLQEPVHAACDQGLMAIDGPG